MKKQVLCLSVVLAAVMGLQSAVTKNKHLVQEHITALENKLKTQPLYAEDRRKVLGHLRGYFNNIHHNGHKKLKPLSANARQIADSVIAAHTDIEKTAGNHKQAGTNYAQRATGVIALNVRPHGAGKMKSLKPAQPTGAEPVAKSKKSGGWLQDMESKLGLGDEEPSQKPVRSSVGRVGGVAAAGAAGAAAGTVAASRAQKAKVSAKKVVDPKKKAQKLERKRKRAAAAKKAGPKKPRTKPMSEKKRAKKARQAAAARRAKAN